MPFTILLKRNLVGAVPTPEDMCVGELALDSLNGIAYTKLVDGTIEAIGEGEYVPVSGSASMTGPLHITSTLDAIDYGSGSFVTDGGASFAKDVRVGGDLHVNGDVFASGDAFIIQAETVEIEDNLLVLNNGEIGSGVTLGTAGIQVDRGTATDYLSVFDEPTDTFRIGEVGDTQSVATREDSPISSGIAIWNKNYNSFVTTSGFMFNIDSEFFGQSNQHLVVDGGLVIKHRNIDQSGTLALSDHYVTATASGNAVGLTLPSGAGIVAGLAFDVNTDDITHGVTLTGDITTGDYVFTNTNNRVKAVFNGSQWEINNNDTNLKACVAPSESFEYFKPPWDDVKDWTGTSEEYRYGEIVTVSENGLYVAVSVHTDEDDGTPADLERVYTYHNNGSTWDSVTIDSPVALAGGHNFGRSIDIANDGTLAIGCPFYDDTHTDQGAVYVYKWSGATCPLEQIVVATSSVQSSAYLGSAVRIHSDGDYMSASASEHDQGTEDGVVFTFSRSGSTWTESDYLYFDGTIDLDRAGDRHGQLSMENKHIAISDTTSDLNGISTGRIIVHRHNGSVYDKKYDINAPSHYGSISDEFGFTIALSTSENSVIEGDLLWSYSQNDETTNDFYKQSKYSISSQGIIHLYQYNNIDDEYIWQSSMQTWFKPPQSVTEFGYSIWAEGSNLLIGAFEDDVMGTGVTITKEGSAALVNARKDENDKWYLSGTKFYSGWRETETGEGFGRSVCMKGGNIFIGSFESASSELSLTGITGTFVAGEIVETTDFTDGHGRVTEFSGSKLYGKFPSSFSGIDIVGQTSGATATVASRIYLNDIGDAYLYTTAKSNTQQITNYILDAYGQNVVTEKAVSEANLELLNTIINYYGGWKRSGDDVSLLINSTNRLTLGESTGDLKITVHGKTGISSTTINESDTTISSSENADPVVLYTTGNTNRTATLPLSSSTQYEILFFIKMDSGTGYVIIDGNGGETISGLPTYTLTNQYEYVVLYNTGTEWLVLSKSEPSVNITQIATTTTLDATHDIVTVDASSGAVTIDLPDATTIQGKEYKIKAIDVTNDITVDGNGSQTIDGSTKFVFNSSMLYDSITIVSDGSNWWIF